MPVVARESEVYGSFDTEARTVSEGALVFEHIRRAWTGYPPTVVVSHAVSLSASFTMSTTASTTTASSSTSLSIHSVSLSASFAMSDAGLRPIAKLWESFERPRPTLSRLGDSGESSRGAVVTRSGRPEPSIQTPGENRAEAAISLIQEWLADESGYDEETWPELKRALERDRLSSRKLFRD